MFNFDYFTNVPKNKQVFDMVNLISDTDCFNPHFSHFMDSKLYINKVLSDFSDYEKFISVLKINP
jgi:hypothetical protein